MFFCWRSDVVPTGKICVDFRFYFSYIPRMFIRRKVSPKTKKTSIQIVESRREGKKVRQHIVRHIGSAEEPDELQALLDLAAFVKEKLEDEKNPSLFDPMTLSEIAALSAGGKATKLGVDLGDIREEKRVVLGIHEVYGRAYRELGFNKAIANPARNRALANTLFQMVMARISQPMSKRASVFDLADRFNVHLSTSSVYRMMDAVDEKVVNRIIDRSFEAARRLLPDNLTVVFYDCTTLYFESFVEDELKENGFSKDGKHGQAQVLLALLITQEGLPIGYALFPGATYEGNTLIFAIEKIKERLAPEKITVVADAGLLNKRNLALLEAHGFYYIVAARMGWIKGDLQEQVLDSDAYSLLYKTDAGSEKDNRIRFRDLDYGEGRRLVMTWKAKRAKKNKHDREKAIEKLRKKLAKSKKPKSFLKASGYKRFLSIQGEGKVDIDETKIKESERWDGLHGLITNLPAKAFNAQHVIYHYRGLWQIEDCFRVAKTDLRIRPIYHWTPRRIKAHIAICFMALVCVRYLTYRVKNQYKPLSPKAIRHHLTSIQASILKSTKTKKRYALPANATEESHQIDYRLLGKRLTSHPHLISS